MAEVLAPREARPWPPRRVATTLGGLALLGAIAIGGTVGAQAYQEKVEVDRFCGALTRPVDGLGPVTMRDGSMAAGSWLTVLTTWRSEMSPADGTLVHRAVRADADGFAELQEALGPDLGADAGHLYDRMTFRGAWPDAIDSRALEAVRDLQQAALETCGIAP